MLYLAREKNVQSSLSNGRNHEKEKNEISWIGIMLMLLIFFVSGILFYADYRDIISQNNVIIVLFFIILLGVPIRHQFKQKMRSKKTISTEHSAEYEHESEQPIENRGDAFPKPHTGSNQSKKPIKWMNVIPVFILGFALFWVFVGNPLDYILPANPVGKWYYDMEVVGGNLTEYFHDDGTLTISIKNVGYPEDKEGSGTLEC